MNICLISTESNLYLLSLFILISLPVLPEARIYSTQQLGAIERNQPRLRSMSAGSNDFMFSRKKRSFSSSDSGAEQLISHQTDLGNYTDHNQALIQWSGHKSQVIFVLTRKKALSPRGMISSSVLWRSTDYGKTYGEETDKLSDGNRKVILESFYVCPKNFSKVVFVESHGSINRVWVTVDEGVSYQTYEISFSIDKVVFHPDEQDWVLGYDKDSSTLHVSQDLGRTWTKVHDGVTNERYFWYIKGVDDGVDASSIIHFEYRDLDIFPEQIYLIHSCYVPDCTPTSFQQHCDDVGAVARKSLVVQDNYAFIQKSGAREQLYVSYMRGPFVKAKFPGHGEQTEFHIISSDSHTVVVGVNHEGGVTDLFTSDVKGQEFVLSISNVRYFDQKSNDGKIFNVDIHEVKSVNGTFIANTLTPEGMNVTMITWDNGCSWTHLAIPETEARCPGCHLNLHCLMSMTRSGYYVPLMLSKNTIPGVIIAHGSVSKTLVDAPSLINVYISEDAGLHWRKALEKRHLFVIGDHGAMIVGIQMIFLKQVQTLSFSNDGGATWSKHKFSKLPINPDGLLTEPGEYTHKFTLFGHRPFRQPWSLYALDFINLVSRNCSYPGDYQNWTFSPNPENSCQLGMTRTFEQVRTRNCLVGPEYKRATTTKLCGCQESDYECGYGYVRQFNGECVTAHPKIDNVGDVFDEDYYRDDVDDYDSKCADGTQRVPPKFRRIPGDRCIDDLPSKVEASCEPAKPSESSPVVELQLLNKTDYAIIGEELHFSYHSVGSNPVQLSVHRISEPKLNWRDFSIKTTEDSDGAGTATLLPNVPGDYEIRAYIQNQPVLSDTMFVSFWYPIEDVTLLHPPVVEVNTEYNATALITTKFGERGTSSLIGSVSYTWIMENQANKLTPDQNSNFISIKHSKAQDYKLSVTAKNVVSQSRAKGKVVVKEYVVTLALPLRATRQLNESILTHEWLDSVGELVTDKIFSIPHFGLLLSSRRLINAKNFHVFVEPRLPLQAKLLFSPSSDGKPSKEALVEAADKAQKVLSKNTFVIHLPKKLNLIVGTPSLLTANPQTSGPHEGVSAGVAVLLAILCLLLVAGIILVARRASRNSKWRAYFTLRHPRNVSLRTSHIVRSRRNDCDPIVDSDEFIDDDLENMESIASPQVGTLQFR